MSGTFYILNKKKNNLRVFLSIDEWIKKMLLSSHSVIAGVYTNPHNEILRGPKKNEILPCAATWTDLEGIVLSEVSQKGKYKCYMISFICGI